jgi:hypothetical protein
MSRQVIVAGLRRLTLLLAGSAAGTTLLSLAIGELAGTRPARAISLGFYLVGSFTLVAGFFVGNRGPVRMRDDRAGASAGLAALSRRQLRWARRDEQVASIADSAVFVMVGVVLVLLGVAVDPR